MYPSMIRLQTSGNKLRLADFARAVLYVFPGGNMSGFRAYKFKHAKNHVCRNLPFSSKLWITAIQLLIGSSRKYLVSRCRILDVQARLKPVRQKCSRGLQTRRIDRQNQLVNAVVQTALCRFQTARVMSCTHIRARTYKQTSEWRRNTLRNLSKITQIETV